MLGAPKAPSPNASAPSAKAQESVVKEESGSPAMDLATISVSAKLPEFWADSPRLWFAQFEAVMAPQKQGEETKYNLVIAKLGKDAIQQVSDILETPPEVNKYSVIKERLLQVYEESAEQQFQKLVSELELGAQKPTQLLRRMKDLGRSTQVSEQTIKNLWLSRMPSAVKAVMAVCQEQSVEGLAIIADKVVENTRGQEIAELKESSSHEQVTLVELANHLHKLTLEVAALRGEVQDRGRDRNQGQQRYRSRSNSRKRGDPGWLCKYHYRYGRNARTCEEPCAWDKGKQGTSTGN